MHFAIPWLLIAPTTLGDVTDRIEKEPCPFARRRAPYAVLCRSYLAEFIDQIRLHSGVGSAALLELYGNRERAFVLATDGYAEFFTSLLPVGKLVPVGGGIIVLEPDVGVRVNLTMRCANGSTYLVLRARAKSSFRYAPYGGGVVFVEENNEEVVPLFVPTKALCAAGVSTLQYWKRFSLLVDRTLDSPRCRSEGCADVRSALLPDFVRRVWFALTD